MKKNIDIIKLYSRKYPSLKKHCSSELCFNIHNEIKTYVQDEDILVCSLIQNPLEEVPELKLQKIKSDFPKKISSYLKTLNRLHNLDKKLIEDFNRHKSVIILFLINYLIIFQEKSAAKKYPQAINRKKIFYAMKLLAKTDITGIRSSIEDIFFSYLYPQIYNNYLNLLNFTKKKYKLKQKEVIGEFQQLMKETDINAVIEARVKTIYSIHHKIIKKNILFSQILDTVGIRIIVNREEECYKAMATILKSCPIVSSRVKDYIAIPKENGYQSIHLTIYHYNQPLEIQIRTKAMHAHAQYGRASHADYKSREK